MRIASYFAFMNHDSLVKDISITIRYNSQVNNFSLLQKLLIYYKY